MASESYLDPPPPYTSDPLDTTRERTTADIPPSTADSSLSTPPSTIASLTSTRSSSPTLPPTDIRKAPLPQSPARAAAELPPTQPANSVQAPKAPPPPNVTRGRAPLQIVQKNKSITTDLLICYPKDGSSGLPDVSLQTKNSRISSTLYIDDTDWGRPVQVEAQTKNSSLSLAVHTLRPGQTVDIQAETKNSSASLLLPQDFTGLLILSTTNGKEAISPRLQEVALRVTNQFNEDQDDEQEVCYEINGSDKPSRAVVRTKNSSVWAGFVGEEDELSRGSCLIM